jgi:DNA-binding MarR family transcriptional regulator
VNVKGLVQACIKPIPLARQKAELHRLFGTVFTHFSVYSCFAYHCIYNYYEYTDILLLCQWLQMQFLSAILRSMTTERLSEQHLTAWRAFLKAHAIVVDRIDHDLLAARRVPLSSYDVLIELYEAPDQRLRMHELAQRVVLSRSGLTRLVDRLEAEGLLTRDRCGTDRRGAFAVLTEQGIAALRQAWPVYAKGISQYFAQWLTPEEALILGSAFERIEQASSKK